MAPAFYAYKVICEATVGTTIGKFGLKVQPRKYPPLVTALIRNSWLLLPFLLSSASEFFGRVLDTLMFIVVLTSMAADKRDRSCLTTWPRPRS